MPRTREIPRDEAHPFAQQLYGLLFDERDPVEEPGTATGTPGNWWTVTAQVPEMFDHVSPRSYERVATICCPESPSLPVPVVIRHNQPPSGNFTSRSTG